MGLETQACSSLASETRAGVPTCYFRQEPELSGGGFLEEGLWLPKQLGEVTLKQCACVASICVPKSALA